jgi:hypothetical protein
LTKQLNSRTFWLADRLNFAGLAEFGAKTVVATFAALHVTPRRVPTKMDRRLTVASHLRFAGLASPDVARLSGNDRPPQRPVCIGACGKKRHATSSPDQRHRSIPADEQAVIFVAKTLYRTGIYCIAFRK